MPEEKYYGFVDVIAGKQKRLYLLPFSDHNPKGGI
jgi:hypothetical protein